MVSRGAECSIFGKQIPQKFLAAQRNRNEKRS
jgi:hypothetical protein